ncbi:hypothetical protein FNV43_RR15048 [Rhamnella rubrinervis]|uniref:Peroxidase n=1 Tax=Rhamnella rubrinervis TaxID=2594499 RepID=A0A8K0E0T9_9ROSA|nr:hypothetical protein FNV43_RR15048 [Rhamnella rubrinervis]
MMMVKKSALFFLVFLVYSVFPNVMGDLSVGFYNSTCPQAESIIRQVVQTRMKSNPFTTAGLLRMHFHDCFVRGCDASILIDSTKNKPSEKTTGPNLSFHVLIIITVATRDAVSLSGGPNYVVPTGRRDGLLSNPNDVNLPGPSSSIQGALQAFTAKGLTLNEMVTLLGAHTVGVSHCAFFQDRLFDFEATGLPDPPMDAGLLAKMQGLCGNVSRPLNSDPTAFLDQNTSFAFDNQFYNQILLKKGVLQINQELVSDSSTNGVVSGFASNGMRFIQSFADAMVRMGSIDVLVGNAGEIRKNCRVFNGVTGRKGKKNPRGGF